MSTQASEVIASQVGSAINNQKTWGSIIYNVKDPQYGAKGDGVTDDTASVQAAVNAAIAKNGTLVFFPPGSYKVTALSNTSTINFVGDTASFVGYVGTILQFGISSITNKNTFTPIYNVKGYTAKGDTVTDDTIALQNAINAASAAGGGTVFFPKGTYMVSSPIVVPPGVALVGVYGVSTIYAGATMDCAVDLKGSMECMRVNGNNKANKGVKLTQSYAYLERCVFEYCVYGIYNNGFDVHRFINCSTQNNTYGIYSVDRFINCFIYGLTSQNNTYGAYFTHGAQQPQSVFFTQCLFYGDQYGVVFEKDVFVLVITDSVFDGIVNRAIWLKDLTANLGDDIIIRNNYIGAGEIPIYIGAGYGHIVIDSNPRIDNGSYYGIVINASASLNCNWVLITNNSLGNNTSGDMLLDSPNGCYVSRNRFGNVSGININTTGTFTGTKPLIYVKENTFTKANPVSTFNTVILDNYGYVTNNSGLGSMPVSGTTVTVNHGLSVAPTQVFVTPQGNMGNVWVTSIGATSFVVNCSTAPVGSPIQFAWNARK